MGCLGEIVQRERERERKTWGDEKNVREIDNFSIIDKNIELLGQMLSICLVRLPHFYHQHGTTNMAQLTVKFKWPDHLDWA